MMLHRVADPSRCVVGAIMKHRCQTTSRQPMTLPTHTQVLIVGGGIAGCSTAYHLARLGIMDVLLL